MRRDPHKRGVSVNRRNGRLRLAGDMACGPVALWRLQVLCDDVRAEFGRGVARKVVRQLTVPPYRLGPVYEVGTAARVARLQFIVAAGLARSAGYDRRRLRPSCALPVAASGATGGAAGLRLAKGGSHGT